MSTSVLCSWLLSAVVMHPEMQGTTMTGMEYKLTIPVGKSAVIQIETHHKVVEHKMEGIDVVDALLLVNF